MRHLLTTLTLTTIAGIVFWLTVYALSGKNPLYRIGFALLVGIPPAVITFLLFRIAGLVETWYRVVIVYVALFAMTIILQGVLRMV